MSSQNKSLQNDDELEKAQEIKKLKERIEKLKTCLIHLEYEAGADKFKNIEHHFDSSSEDELPNDASSKRTVNVETQFCSDIFRFAGSHCVRATKEQIVFHLSSGSKWKKEYVFMVQMLIKEGKLSIGRWIMPPSVYMDILESEVPLNSNKDIPLFLKTCKHYITCFVTRSEQFEALKEIAPRKGKCSVQSNMGLTEIILDFLNVLDTRENSVLNLRVNLLYNAKEVRPNVIAIQNKAGEDLSSAALKYLKNSLKVFKSEDLNIAFEKVLTKESGPFVWQPLSDETIVRSPNQSNDYDDFQEKSIDSLASPRKRQRANVSQDSDSQEKSDNDLPSRKKARKSPRIKEVNNADISKEKSVNSLLRKQKAFQPSRSKKVHNADDPKKKSANPASQKQKVSQPLRIKQVQNVNEPKKNSSSSLTQKQKAPEASTTQEVENADDPRKKSANSLSPMQKGARSPRTKEVQNENDSKKKSGGTLSQKQKVSQTSRSKKVQDANHSKGKSTSSLPPKLKRPRTTRLKKVK